MTDRKQNDKQGEAAAQRIRELCSERILLLDGAMGTMIQGYSLEEEHYRGERFADHSHDLKGNNDLLNVTRPDIIGAIHREFLKAGSDIIETNTFSGTTIAQADYGLEDAVDDINRGGAEIARQAADEFTAETPDKPRFVAGAIGPTNKTLSVSPDVNRPGWREVTFDEVKDAYKQQIEGLVDGGVDLLLVETIFDTLNAKAALVAIDEVNEARGIKMPVMISGTVTDLSGRNLSGQTMEAVWHSVRHAHPLTIGLNCSFGAEELRPHIEMLSTRAAPKPQPGICANGPRSASSILSAAAAAPRPIIFRPSPRPSRARRRARFRKKSPASSCPGLKQSPSKAAREDARRPPAARAQASCAVSEDSAA